MEISFVFVMMVLEDGNKLMREVLGATRSLLYTQNTLRKGIHLGHTERGSDSQ
jgi:hypothetical protein